ANERRAGRELVFGESEWRAWLFCEAIDVDAPDALHAAVRRISRGRRPTQDHFVSLLGAGKKLCALLYAFDRRQRRPALAATRNANHANHKSTKTEGFADMRHVVVVIGGFIFAAFAQTLRSLRENDFTQSAPRLRKDRKEGSQNVAT